MGANESRAVSSAQTCTEERTDAAGNAKKPLRATAPEGKERMCVICSKPSEGMICGACADKICADALEKKRWEEAGKA